jgi:FkbM family methyltransferase
VDDYNGENNLDMHTNGEFRLLRRVLGSTGNCLIFDVGANIGNWTKEVLKINPLANVHCFEPCGSTFRILQSRDFPTNVILNNFGLGSSKSTNKMYIYGDSGGSNSLYLRTNLEPIKSIEIHLESLSNYCRERSIDFIEYLKIDAEGHDFEVLKGAADLLENDAINFVQFEYGIPNIDSRVFLKDVWILANKYNYQLCKINNRSLFLIEFYDACMDNFQSANYVLIHNRLLDNIDNDFRQFE